MTLVLRKSRIFIVIALALFALGSSAAYATSGGVINACVQHSSGIFKLANASGACGPSEDALSWNQFGQAGASGPTGATGPQGPTGAQGATGATGSQGAAGANGAKGDKGDKGDQGLRGLPGLSGVELVRGPWKAMPTGFGPFIWVSATCPDGKFALSGGAEVTPAGGFATLGSASVADGATVPNGWVTYVTTSSGGSLPKSAQILVTPYVVCAAASQ